MIKRNPKWSRPKIIREIRCLFRENQNITPEEIRINHRALYGATQRGRYFSGWRQAVKAAGLRDEYNEIVRKQQRKVIFTRKRTETWSIKIIQERIMSLHKKGVSLDGGYIRKHYFNLLHAADHKRYFGSWKKAVESVGINYNALIRARKKTKRTAKIVFLKDTTNKIINKWLRYLRERNFSIRTINRYLHNVRMLDHYLDGMELKKIVDSNIRDFVIYLAKKGYSPGTVSHYYSPLKNLFDFCIINKHINDNPLKLYYFPKPLERISSVITEKELRAFLHYLNNRTEVNGFVKMRDKVLVGIIAYCGLRCEEARHLKLKHLDLGEETLIVEQGKRKRDRLVPLNGNILYDLRLYLKLRKPSRSPYLLLTNNKCNPLSHTYAAYLFRRLNALSGLKCRISAKIIRSTFATLLYEKGVSLKSIQALMGHSKIDTTFQYINASVNYLRKEIEKHPLLNN